MIQATRASCFDASALVKLYIDEDGSEKLRSYWSIEPTKFTTSLCFYETLTQLKVYHFYRKVLDLAAYKEATLDLCSWFSTVVRSIQAPNFFSPRIFFEAQHIAEKYKTDLSDAFQICSIKEGFFSKLSGESKTILVTADNKLAKVARCEGIRVWNVLKEQAPLPEC